MSGGKITSSSPKFSRRFILPKALSELGTAAAQTIRGESGVIPVSKLLQESDSSEVQIEASTTQKDTPSPSPRGWSPLEGTTIVRRTNASPFPNSSAEIDEPLQQK